MLQELLTEHSEIHLPVRNRSPEVRYLEFLVFRTRLVIIFEASNDSSPVLFRKESCSIGKVMHHEEGESSEANSDDAFDDENPGPSRAAMSTI